MTAMVGDDAARVLYDGPDSLGAAWHRTAFDLTPSATDAVRLQFTFEWTFSASTQPPSAAAVDDITLTDGSCEDQRQ